MTIITRISLLGLALVATTVLVLAAGAQAGRETQLSQVTSLWSPVWSPDGRHIAWVAVAEGKSANFTDTVWVANSSGRKARALHRFIRQEFVPQLTWVTPTSLIANPEQGLYHLWLSGRVRLLPQMHAVVISLDPSRRFVAGEYSDCPHTDCAGSIKVLDLQTGRVRRVGSPADVNVNPTLSPGAARVAYQRTTCDSQTGDCQSYRGIWAAPVDGRGEPHRILRGYTCPVWSPDGRLIAYTRPAGYPGGNYRPGSIGILHVGGSGRLIASPASSCGSAFSPDSRFIAYQADNVPNTPGNRLAVLDLGTRHIVLRSPRDLGEVDGQAWSPDGSKIVLVARYHDPDALGCVYVGNVATRRWRLFRPCANAF